MEALTIPPSPSWYLSDNFCTGPNGQVIYGTRFDVIILNFDFNSPGNLHSPKLQTVDYAHKERITAVRCCPNVKGTFGNCFVSAGDDSLVKLWDFKTLTPINVNFAHGDDKKIISLDWSPIAQNEIVSADDTGGIVVWDIGKNITNKLNISNLLKMKKSMGIKVNVGKFSPSTIKCCPHERDLLAVGMKGGIVCLISTKDSGKVLHCLRGHDKDVSSLAWCPELGNILDEKDDHGKTLVFASVCKDRVINFWNALNGRFIRIIKLPTLYLGRNARLPSASPPLLSWPNKHTILSSSNFGEVLQCNLYNQRTSSGDALEEEVEIDTSKKSKSIWTLVHDVHPRGVFSIHTALYANEGKGTKNTVVWTTAQDRNLVAFSLEDEKVLVNMPTIGGFVYCIAPSPLDPSRVAVGLGDFSIRIWNTGNAKAIQMSSLWHKIKGKVMAVAWHPTQEMKLAYGTHEGRVGIQDLIPGHLPKDFILHHHHPVYALSWGPPCFKEGGVHKFPKFCLYSCGEGVILMYDPDEPEKEPQRINTLMKGGREENSAKKKGSGCTDIAWKPDYSLFAVGNSDGTVQLYSAPHLELVHTIFAHQKLLMCLAWHPMSTSSDVGLSPLQHCLATGSNDRTIHVFDLTSLMKSIP
ncbi:hypothetical protein J437_LFUL007496 [Ladona fulva]|uniref:Uncharacterized protein n=1 Tax=Ladona fulva TaxID=123851 RepID=A0A8K0KFW2_LADFU|nr:hypothetical protein J437_LFUL007496 [Ladona fulva]